MSPVEPVVVQPGSEGGAVTLADSGCGHASSPGPSMTPSLITTSVAVSSESEGPSEGTLFVMISVVVSSEANTSTAPTGITLTRSIILNKTEISFASFFIISSPLCEDYLPD